MNTQDIKELLNILGFKPEESKTNIYIKKYNQYVIRIDFNLGLIDYGNKITLGDKTTSNFSSSENFVVLECVNRLLDMGYSPEKLTLEIKWDLGRKEKGKLDIYVADKDDDTKCFLMIECKTFGSEYEKEKKNMLSKGGQLFSYFQQDKSAQYLCLYASRLNNNEIEYVNSIVEVEEDFRIASNKNETYTLWNKMFKDNGIFEDWTNVYDIKSKALIRSKLKPLQQSDSGFIFNRFAEILRHNIVSDKSNAFNKIFNLFLCKIEDEDKNPDEELSFQWKEDDNHISLQKRLNNLYKEGMRKFLSIEVTDFNEKDLDKELNTLSGVSKKHIEDMFTKLRLYKNNEFAFKEVFDDASFEENATVLKEVVELLQPYQLRYTHKQQFLGDFFELLLNTGLKQESGQFFTPVPVAKFISSSIPLQEIIEEKINAGEINFLPYVIDYAAGSGHFLTEVMDEIQHIIEDMNHDKYKDSVKRKLKGFKEDTYAWAEEFIYGIEKDYRLVKTAKVACFLNGDGLAKLIHGDGLDSFKISKDFIGKLKSDSEEQNNQQFDVIIANPPYSVSAFKNTMKQGDKSFDLYNRITDTSSEIECLFIERTKQLLKEGGYAGIVLPSSILSNGGIYIDTRDIILKYFDIVAITELGSNTFMATGTNTVTLFLKKRNDSHWLRVQDSINEFFKTFKDITTNGIEKAYSKYVENVYENIDLNDYLYLLNAGKLGTSNKIVEELLTDYKKLFGTTQIYKSLIQSKDYKNANKLIEEQNYLEALKLFIQEKEKEKLLYFMLSYKQQVVLIKSGDKQIEKDFLGYEFSNRRGHEGIRMFTDPNGKPITKLYDMDNLFNEEKVNSYIHRAFLDTEIKEETIPESLENHVYIKQLHELINFNKINFEKDISLVVKKKLKIETQWDMRPLGEVCNVKIGGTPSRSEKQYYQNAEHLWVSISEMNGNIINDTKEKINDLGVKNSNVKLIKAGTTLLSFKLSIGKTAIAGKDLYTNEAIAALEIKNKEQLLNDYLFVLFNSKIIDLDTNFKAFGKSLNSATLKEILIPVPPINIQEEVIKEFNNNKNKINIIKSKKEAKENEIKKLFEKFNDKKTPISEICETSSGGTPLTSKKEYYNGGDIPWLTSSEVRTGKIYKSGNFITQKGLEESSAKYFPENSVLIAMYGATAGQVGLLKFKSTTNQAICALLPNEKYLPEYLFFYLKDKTEELISLTIGKAQKNLSQAIIKEYKIPIPDLEEQAKIVEAINKIEKDINFIEEELEELQIKEAELLKEYL
ncbi:restriction endonuclease subunit S [Aliarcobacter butzleri]|uniref:restriction endonuclease subunit S n=1 Tax=Aliarcobacter butzleri TaxID=28197 RepID=UPI0021B1B97E|nr:restriction endonuclease subunit S [Aliarcobacter butzleri]MCT7596131.1 restriction endonuclease subunit S [Aliarcobacter butzleri]